MGERAPNLDQHEEKHDPGKGMQGTAGQVDVPTGGTAGMPEADPSGMGGPGLAGTGTGSDQPQMQAGWDEQGEQHDHLEEIARQNNAILHGDEDKDASKG